METLAEELLQEDIKKSLVKKITASEPGIQTKSVWGFRTVGIL
jgi:hypothetical protein